MEPFPSTEMCYVCGRANAAGMHLDFFSDGDKVQTEFETLPEHQGYNHLLHGGILTSVFDDVLFRVGWMMGLKTITGRLEVWFRKPVPIGETVRVVGRLDHQRGRWLHVKGEAFLQDGTLAAEANGSFAVLVATGDSQGRVADHIP